MAEKKWSFEQAMARLEEIVRQLEQGDAPLDQALALSRELNGGKDLRATLMPHGANTLPKFA